MTKLYLSIGLCLFYACSFAQAKTDTSVFTLKIAKTPALIESMPESVMDLTPVKKGQVFTVSVRNRYRSSVLNGIFKTLGAGALTYQFNNMISPHKKNGQQSKVQKLSPAVAIGLGAGVKDIFRSRPKHTCISHYIITTRSSYRQGKSGCGGNTLTLKG